MDRPSCFSFPIASQSPWRRSRQGRNLLHLEALGDLRPLVHVDLADAQAVALLARDVREQALHPPGGPGAAGGEEHEQRAVVWRLSPTTVELRLWLRFPRGFLVLDRRLRRPRRRRRCPLRGPGRYAACVADRCGRLGGAVGAGIGFADRRAGSRAAGATVSPDRAARCGCVRRALIVRGALRRGGDPRRHRAARRGRRARRRSPGLDSPRRLSRGGRAARPRGAATPRAARALRRACDARPRQ